VIAPSGNVAVHGAVPNVGLLVAHRALVSGLLIPKTLPVVWVQLSPARRDERALVRAGSWRARPTEDVPVSLHESCEVHINHFQIRVRKSGGDPVPFVFWWVGPVEHGDKPFHYHAVGDWLLQAVAVQSECDGRFQLCCSDRHGSGRLGSG